MGSTSAAANIFIRPVPGEGETERERERERDDKRGVNAEEKALGLT